MKSGLALILTLIASVAWTISGAYGDCDATWTSTIITSGCPNLLKTQDWTITWDDGNTSLASNTGNGQCCGIFFSLSREDDAVSVSGAFSKVGTTTAIKSTA